MLHECCANCLTCKSPLNSQKNLLLGIGGPSNGAMDMHRPAGEGEIAETSMHTLAKTKVHFISSTTTS